MMDISFRRLQVFKTVVDTGRFGRAAERLGIAPPSVSAHITALEQHVGHALFVRHRGSPPRLTKIGGLIYDYADDVIERTADLDAALEKLRQGETGTFSLAAQRNLANVVLPGHVAEFLRLQPGVKIVTYSETQERVIDLVLKGNVDFGLLFTLGPIDGLESEAIGTHPLVLVASPNHPLARRASISPEDLSGFPFVGGLERSQFSEIVTTVLGRLGVGRVNFASHLQDSVGVKELARHGVGIACTLACAVKNELADGSLIAINLPRPPEPLEVRWVYDDSRDIPEAAISFIQHLKSSHAFE